MPKGAGWRCRVGLIRLERVAAARAAFPGRLALRAPVADTAQGFGLHSMIGGGDHMILPGRARQNQTGSILSFVGAPGRIRTCDTRFIKLFPA